MSKNQIEFIDSLRENWLEHDGLNIEIVLFWSSKMDYLGVKDHVSGLSSGLTDKAFSGTVLNS